MHPGSALPSQPEPGRDNRPQELHRYLQTIGGRCHQCARTEPEHVSYLPQPDPMTECLVDHASINTAVGITDGGLVWRRCPHCQSMVEGAMRTGVLVGTASGPGRGDLTMRQKARLLAWTGWADFNGGS